MNRDDVLLAMEKVASAKYDLMPKTYEGVVEVFAHFASIVAAAEREACAKAKQEPVPLGPHPDTVRLAYLYNGTQTSSDALVNAEMKLLNGETLTLEEARAAIDDAMSKPMKY